MSYVPNPQQHSGELHKDSAHSVLLLYQRKACYGAGYHSEPWITVVIPVDDVDFIMILYVINICVSSSNK